MIRVPVRYVYRGDLQECRSLHGYAHKAMHLLENIMELRGLEQHSIQIIPYPGALVVASKVFGLREVWVYAGQESEPVSKEAKKIECLCYPNFSFAYIVKEWTTIAVPSDLYTKRFEYDVFACMGGRKFIPLEGLPVAGFERCHGGPRR